MRIAVYPGSFDPVTNGHIDIIHRASKAFDKLIVVVLNNSNKQPLFTVAERVELLQKSCESMEHIEIDSYSGMLIEYAQMKNAHFIVKGLRAVSDFEYEFQMALMNRKLNTEIETMFLMTCDRFSYLSSSMVKEVARYNGDISELVPEIVEKKIKEKLA